MAFAASSGEMVNGIKAVSIKHEAILDHLLCHPQVSLGDVARHFGITQGWLSQVIHSDAFQERLREKQGVAFHHTVLPIREKMLMVAHQALDRLTERLPLEDEPRNLSAIASDVLDRLGFSSKGPAVQVNTQNIHITSLRDEIAAAQTLMGRSPSPPPLEIARDGERTVLALPSNGALSEVLTNGEARLGTSFQAASFSLDAFENRESEAGGSIREESP